ncbi:MAG: DinB family protein [Thermoanaerobaculia bacterium]|nr:DinB family protein [Thermoanaerobaculia bacterium]
MKLRPEQQLALDYARRAGTEAAKDRIRDKMARTFADLEDLLGSISEPQAREKPAADSWSIQQVVDHLVESHRPAVAELESVLSGRAPATDPIPAGLQSADPMSIDWAEMVARLRRVHADLLGTVDQASDDAPLDAKVTIVMVVKCRYEDGSIRPVEWLEPFDWKAYCILLRAHTLEHVHQIRRAMETVVAG